MPSAHVGSFMAAYIALGSLCPLYRYPVSLGLVK